MTTPCPCWDCHGNTNVSWTLTAAELYHLLVLLLARQSSYMETGVENILQMYRKPYNTGFSPGRLDEGIADGCGFGTCFVTTSIHFLPTSKLNQKWWHRGPLYRRGLAGENTEAWGPSPCFLSHTILAQDWQRGYPPLAGILSMLIYGDLHHRWADTGLHKRVS